MGIDKLGKGKNRAATNQNLAHEIKNIVDELIKVTFQAIIRAPVFIEFLEIADFPRFRLAFLHSEKGKSYLS